MSFPIHVEERLESRLEQALSKAGIKDQDVQSTVREERSQAGQVWIQTTRVLVVPPTLELKQVQKKILEIAKGPGLKMRLSRQNAQGTVLDIFWGSRCLERVVLKTAVAAPRKRAEGPAHKVALVIDDVMGKPEPLKRYFELGVPLTFAILPGGKNSRTFSHLLAQKKDRCEYILHLPLEPHKSWPDKAHQLLHVSMTPAEKIRLLEKDLDDVPGADGVSNHMGSAFTENEASMKTILEKIKTRRIFFFDSHTSLKTVGYPTARAMGIPTALNQVFLDNEDDAAYIGRQLDILLKSSKKRKATAAIGHFHRKHLAEALAKAIPEFKRNGIEFVKLQDVLESPL